MIQKAERTVYLTDAAVQGLSTKTEKDREIKTKISEGLDIGKRTLGLIKNNSLYKGTSAITGRVNDADIDTAISEMLAFDFDKNVWGPTPPSPAENSPIKRFVRTVVLRDLLRFKAGVGATIPKKFSPGQGALDNIYARHSSYLLDCKLGLTSNSNLRIPRYAELDSCIATTYSIMFPENPRVPIVSKQERYDTVQASRKNPGSIKQLIIAEFPGLGPAYPADYAGTTAVRNLNASAEESGGSLLSSSSSAADGSRYPGFGDNSASSSSSSSSSTPEPEVGEYYKIVQIASSIGQIRKNVIKITRKENGRVYYLKNLVSDPRAAPTDESLPINIFLQNISAPDSNGYQFIKMTDEERDVFLETNDTMRGGARKTRNRKMNRRRKTGKRSKPLPLQLS